MALTKAQVSLVTVTALGIAPGGYEATLSALATQKELAAFIANAGLLSTGTNAEFALAIGKNVGLAAGNGAITTLFSALESGTSRADAVVDFANAQLVAGNTTLTAALAKAEAYTGGSLDLGVLKGAVAADVVATPSGLIITFKDEEKDQHSKEDSDTTSTTPNGQTVVNIGKAQIDAGVSKVSADFTFTLANQIGAAEKFEGQFLSPTLERQAADKSGSKIVLELRNLREPSDSATPLKYLPTNGFGFTIDGQLVQITSTAIDAAETYADLLAAIKTRIEELKNGVNLPQDADAALYAKLATFTVELGQTKAAEERDATGNVTKTYDVNVTQIILTDTAGTTLAPVGYSNRDGIIDQSGFTLFAQMSDAEAQTITKLITTNVELDNIGYGSQGATLDIGGQSNSDKGVEEFKVTAKNGVWLTTAVSQGAGENNHLERIELQTGSNGYFRVGTQKNDPNHVVALVDQDFTKGGLVDVQQVEASAAGSVAINSWISDAVLSRYNLKDTGLYTTDDTDALVEYNLTSGSDVLNLAIDTDVLEAVDTKVVVKSGDGNDVVTVMASNGLTADKAVALQVTSAGKGWVTNQQLLDNVTIDAGSGDDWVLTPGAGAAIINAGAGNDVVRVDNAGDRGVFVFNNATTNINKLVTNQDLVSNSDDSLTNNANGTAQTYNFFKAQVQVSFKGFESKFVTIDSTNYQTTTKQINQAIKKAVNEDAVLSKLMFAHDNEGNALGLESLIDGALKTGELVIDIIPPVAYNATESATDKAAREKAGKLMLATDDLTKADTALKLTAGTTTTVTMDTAVAAAEVLYISEFGTNGATTVATTTAGAFEVQNFDLTAVSVANGETLTFTVDGDGATFVYTNNSGGALTGAALTAAITAGGDAIAAALVNGATYTFTQSGATSTLVITQSVLSKNIVDITAANSGAGGTIAAPATGSVNGANEVQTLDLSNVTVAAGETLIFTSAGLTGGVITYTNNTAGDLTGNALATAVATLIDGAGVNEGAAAVGSVVTVTYDGLQATAAGNVAEIVVTGTGAGIVTGTASGAESDNVVNLGTGQDVLVLGTGALSNDTVVITGYDNGVNTIVNFTAGLVAKANGADLLDFTSYLTNVDATTKATVATTLGAIGAAAAGNGISIVDYLSTEKLTTASTTAISFDALTANDVKAMINNDDVASLGLNVDLNATGVATLTQNYVVLVHNDGVTPNNNVGEYKAFHVTSVGNSDEAATVQLIGTFDFGAELTDIAVSNFVGGGVA